MNKREKKEKLVELRIFYKWRDNVLNWATNEYAVYILDKDCDWYHFISHSFPWGKSNEGAQFWADIANK